MRIFVLTTDIKICFLKFFFLHFFGLVFFCQPTQALVINFVERAEGGEEGVYWRCWEVHQPRAQEGGQEN